MAIALETHAAAQCLNWDTRFPQSNRVSGPIYSFAVHDDGSGPWLYMGGDFAVAGGALANGIARWNGTTWGYFGPHYPGYPKALAFFDSGSGPQLCAAGTSDTTNIAWIQLWNGSSWVWPTGTFGGTITGTRLNALAVYDDGTGPSLYAAGVFWRADVWFASNIAKWNGVTWAPLGAPTTTTPGPGTNGEILALKVFDDGSGPALYASGFFTTAGGLAAPGIARWRGGAWEAVGAGVPVPAPRALEVFDDGSGAALYAGRTATGIVRWKGAHWDPVPSTIDGPVEAFAVFDDGTGPALFAGGLFGIEGFAAFVVKWDGAGWSHLGGNVSDEVTSLCVYDDQSGRGPALFAGGEFSTAGTIQSHGLAAWHGCRAPIDTFCFGDGTVADCPCSNRGARGHGCANSMSSSGAKLVPEGDTADDSFTLTAINEPQSSLTILLQGSENLPGWNKFGDGLLCTGGALLRMYTKSAANGSIVVPDVGDPSIRARAAERGDVLGSGSVRWYQAYYRDASASFCPAPNGSTFNTTNGVRVVW